MAKKLFGGLNLGDIARSAKEPIEEGATAGMAPPLHPKPVLPSADLALRGRTQPTFERENIFAVDPKRCRPWRFHNRSEAWYTRKRCADLIESFPKDGQQEPALARKLSGDPDFEYELIYGMRRRYACEALNIKLKIRVMSVPDDQAAVLMHIENADREDITPMERAVSFLGQLQAKLFPTQDAMAVAFNVSRGQVAKMVKAAQIFNYPAIAQLIPDQTGVPVEQSYLLVTALDRPGAKEVVIKAAQNMAARKSELPSAGAILRKLLDVLDNSARVAPLKDEYNVGPTERVKVTRNSKGKVTLAFSKGLKSIDHAALHAVIDQILKDLR